MFGKTNKTRDVLEKFRNSHETAIREAKAKMMEDNGLPWSDLYGGKAEIRERGRLGSSSLELWVKKDTVTVETEFMVRSRTENEGSAE